MEQPEGRRLNTMRLEWALPMEQPEGRRLNTMRLEWERRFRYNRDDELVSNILPQLPPPKQRFEILDELLVYNILPRLPVKTLMRCRCVSKKWLHLISLTKVEHKEKLMYTARKVVGRKHRDKLRHVFTSVDTEKKSQKVGKYRWKKGVDGRLNIAGSCNGLLLIWEYDDLYLWNPLIRYCRKVLSYHRLAYQGYLVVSGLCFDSHNNDYKVVLLLSHRTPSDGGEVVVVGSSRTKDWKPIDFPYKFTSVANGPVLNNYLHWAAASPEVSNESRSIIYYDPTTDQFAPFPMPEPIESNGDIIFGLGVLDGLFCMTRAEEPGKSQGTAQVLIMKEYGVKETWTVLFRVEGVSAQHILKPLIYYGEKKGEVLMRARNVVVAYDIKNKSSRKIATLKYGENAVVYEETMVRPVEYVWDREDVCVDRGIIWERKDYGGWFPSLGGWFPSLENLTV